MVHDVIVIGGGHRRDAPSAAHLAETGRPTLLLERATLGAGASGRNSGVVQHPFDPVLVELHRESRGAVSAPWRSTTPTGFAPAERPAGLLIAVARRRRRASGWRRELAASDPGPGARRSSAPGEVTAPRAGDRPRRGRLPAGDRLPGRAAGRDPRLRRRAPAGRRRHPHRRRRPAWIDARSRPRRRARGPTAASGIAARRSSSSRPGRGHRRSSTRPARGGRSRRCGASSSTPTLAGPAGARHRGGLDRIEPTSTRRAASRSRRRRSDHRSAS